MDLHAAVELISKIEVEIAVAKALQKCKELQDEIERLRAALEYYADDAAYHDHGMGIGVDADVAKQALAAQAAESEGECYD